MAPYQPPNHPVVFTNTDTPGLDRRFPYWNGGGRNPPVLHDGVEYRPAYCKHGWQAQERQPEWLHGTNHTFFGCHGYIKGYNQPDNWDCGYREEGVVGRGVKSIQVFNYAWDGRKWPFPPAREWMERRNDISPGSALSPSPRKGSSTSGPSRTETASSSGSPPKKRKTQGSQIPPPDYDAIFPPPSYEDIYPLPSYDEIEDGPPFVGEAPIIIIIPPTPLNIAIALAPEEPFEFGPFAHNEGAVLEMPLAPNGAPKQGAAPRSDGPWS